MEEGQISKISLPQADGKIKERPVVLLKKLPAFNEWLICGITSQLWQATDGFDLLIDEKHPDFKTSGLKMPGLIRLGFLHVIEERKLPGDIGNLSKETHRQLIDNLTNYLKS